MKAKSAAPANSHQRDLEGLLDLLLDGDFEAVLALGGKRDPSPVTRRVRQLAKILSNHAGVLGRLVEGDLQVRPLPFGQKNQLGAAIAKVVESVATTSQLATEVKRALEEERNKLIQEDWVKSHYANVFSRIQGVRVISELGDIVIGEIAHSVQAQIGAFYIKEHEASGGASSGRPHLKLIASYGFVPGPDQVQFQVGEGVVGQCAADMRTRYMEQMPTDSVSVESGIGRVRLASVVVVPIIYESDLCGVMELASIGPFSEIQKRLIEQIASSIGSSIRGITGTMLTESLLKEIEEKNNSLASQKSALDSAAIVAETDARGRITYVNDKFLEISKYDRKELLGQDHRILNSGHHPKGFFTELWRMIAKGEVWRGEVKNRAKDGTYYWVDTTIYPVKGESGRPLKYVAIRFDITDKKKALEELQLATVQAKEAARMKTEFLTNMSHEIRTPMNAIVGMGEVLRETPLNSDQERYVSILNNASGALLDVINSILDLSKIESGQMNLESIPFDLEEAIHAASDIVARGAHKKNLELAVFIHPDVMTSLTGDPARLRQVLINLLGNAIKFTHQGEVVLRVTNDPARSGFLLFSVQDTGIGIPAEKFERIFGNFSQVDASVSRKYGGSGLGLAISKRIVESMGGQIAFESTEGVGSRFHFCIPATVGAATHSPISLDLLRGVRVLVVDDNETSRSILRELIAAWGMKVDEAESAEDALIKVEAAHREGSDYRVALLDRHLPRGNGIDIGKAVALISERRTIPVLMLTSDDRRGDMGRRQESTAFLTKPVRKRELAKVLLESVQDPQPKWTVLVVDNDDENRRDIAMAMRRSDVQVLEATGGAEALEILRSKKVHAVFTDIKMPGMDGLTFLTEARKLGVAVPFVFTSGYVDAIDDLTGEPFKKMSFLRKPVDRDVLQEVLEDAIDRSVDVRSDASAPRLVENAGEGPRILFVDDVRENLDLVQVYLRNLPYRLDVAISGQEAIEKVRTQKYDLIFMDIQMPMMDGHETTRRIREYESARGIPPTTIVTLSAHALSEESENSIKAGSNGFLTKPIKKKSLIEAIEKYAPGPKDDTGGSPSAA